MRAEEFIELLSGEAKRNVYRFENLRECIPLGLSGTGEFIVSHKEERPDWYHHTCVTGGSRGDFIRRLILTLACVYDKSEAQFLLLSPNAEYGELLRLKNADVTVPYVKTAAELSEALKTVLELVRMRSQSEGYPKLIIVLDGLEQLKGAAYTDVTELYSVWIEALRGGVLELIMGLDLTESIFAPQPGAFVGIGNALVTTKGGGKADVTHVGADSALSLPREIDYPSLPALSDAIDYFNLLV
ncbi:MAG: hypothetical protein IJY62_05135 [Clostridia bacterium]|nr:hypothetical protein [Clostridia bacterium]